MCLYLSEPVGELCEKSLPVVEYSLSRDSIPPNDNNSVGRFIWFSIFYFPVKLKKKAFRKFR